MLVTDWAGPLCEWLAIGADLTFWAERPGAGARMGSGLISEDWLSRAAGPGGSNPTAGTRWDTSSVTVLAC